MSRDGNRISFISPVYDIPQAFVACSDGDCLQQVTDESSGVAFLTLSGDGNVLYVETNAHRILKIDLSTRSTAVVVPDVWQLQ